MLNKNNLSQRNEHIRDIEQTYQIAPLGGYFDGCDLDCEYNTVDFNIDYTSNVKEMEYFLVFNDFDIFVST